MLMLPAPPSAHGARVGAIGSGFAALAPLPAPGSGAVPLACEDHERNIRHVLLRQISLQARSCGIYTAYAGCMPVLPGCCCRPRAPSRAARLMCRQSCPAPLLPRHLRMLVPQLAGLCSVIGVVEMCWFAAWYPKHPLFDVRRQLCLALFLRSAAGLPAGQSWCCACHCSDGSQLPHHRPQSICIASIRNTNSDQHSMGHRLVIQQQFRVPRSCGQLSGDLDV